MAHLLTQPNKTSASSGAPTTTKTFRVFIKDLDKMTQEPYAANGSFLVRLLLDMYFKDQLPAAKLKFLAKVAEFNARK